MIMDILSQWLFWSDGLQFLCKKMELPRMLLDVCLVVYRDDRQRIPNDLLYTLRRDLSLIFQHYGVGDPQVEEGKFIFLNAPALVDEYYVPEHLWEISFCFEATLNPLPHLRELVSEGMPMFIERIKRTMPQFVAMARYTYRAADD